MSKPSNTFRPFQLVKVPFPFTDIPVQKRRPALVLSSDPFNTETGHTLFAMVTSKVSRRWPHDVPITELDQAGLSMVCVVRMKIFTLDNRLIIGRLGELGAKDRAKVIEALDKLMPHRYTGK